MNNKPINVNSICFFLVSITTSTHVKLTETQETILNLNCWLCCKTCLDNKNSHSPKYWLIHTAHNTTKFKMVQGQGNNAYKTSTFDSMDMQSKRSGFENMQKRSESKKECSKPSATTNSAAKKNSWGPVLKDREYFNSMHFCWSIIIFCIRFKNFFLD